MEVWPLPPQGRVRKCHAEPPPARHVFRVLTFHSPIPQIFPEHLLGAWPCRHGVSQKPQTYLLPIRSSQFGVKETHTPISMLERPQTSAQGWVGLQGEEGVLPQESQVASWKRRHAEERGCLSLEHESVSSLRWESRGEGEARQQSPPETEMRLGRSWDAGPQNATRRPCLAPSLSDPRS